MNTSFFIILVVLHAHLHFLLLALVKGGCVIASQISSNSTESLNVLAATHRAGVVQLVSVAAGHTCIIRNINCEVRNIFVHSIVHERLESFQVVFTARVEFNVCDTTGAAIARQLALNINLGERIYFFPDRNVGRVTKN